MTRRAGLLALVLLCFVPVTARAGTYEVWSCAGPNGEPVVADGWRSEGSALNSGAANQCAGGQGLFAGINGSVDQAANLAAISWHFTAPENTRIASFRLWRAAGVEPESTAGVLPSYTLNRDRNVFDGAYVDETCFSRNTCASVGTPATPLADANLTSNRGPAGRDIWLNAACGGDEGKVCPAGAGTAADMAWFRLYRAAIVLADDTDPTFGSPPAGALFAGGTLAGSQGVSFSAADTGSGVQQATLEVDGFAVSTQTLGCSPPYTAIVPCKLSASGTLTLDTATLTDGPHSVRVLLKDAGGNATAYGPFTVTTANTPTACAAQVASELVTRVDRRGTIAYGGRLNVRGTFAGATPGTVVRVISDVKGTAAPRLIAAPLTTDAQGRFTYRVPAGPSRSLRFAYRSGSEAAFRCSKPLVVNVRARVSLSASPRSVVSGSRVRFSGRLRGGHIPRNGKVVELQAFERGRWRTFRTVRSSAKGAFSYRYRFSFRAAGVTFPVRARVRAEAAYPFALGTSNRVRVRVR